MPLTLLLQLLTLVKKENLCNRDTSLFQRFLDADILQQQLRNMQLTTLITKKIIFPTIR